MKELDRFLRQILKTRTCWRWMGAMHSRRTGYGTFSIKRDGKWIRVYSHRFAYEALIGSIPQGLTLDQLLAPILWFIRLVLTGGPMFLILSAILWAGCAAHKPVAKRDLHPAPYNEYGRHDCTPNYVWNDYRQRCERGTK